MTSWTRLGRELTNDDDLYKPYMDSIGAEHVNHYGFINFGDPLEEDFLDELRIKKHIYSTGDNLAKLAYNNYGDPRYWWILAWFNGKPTDFHCKIGDIIVIPFPLENVLNQAYNIVEV
tara:strand:+ start:18606 stop:18959 length:354 start_codon:yes stop_codon:yes gene_type:complete